MPSNVGLLAARLALGSALAAHGAQKAFGSFDGPGPEGAEGYFRSLGFEPADLHVSAAAWNEMIGGGLVALGAFGPIGPAMIVSTMIVAGASAHAGKGFFANKGGPEVSFLYAVGAIAIASSGYGKLSIDGIFGSGLNEKPSRGWLALIAAVLGAAGVLANRNEPPAPASQEPAEG